MKPNRLWLLITISSIMTLTLPSLAVPSEGDIETVFGLSHVGESTAVAFWVPLQESQSISGVRWFNNDGDVVFLEILAVAGEEDQPELLVDALTIATDVAGRDLDWSEFYFTQPLATDAPGIYLIWKLPNGSVFSHSGVGGGAGFGIWAGQGNNRCWLTSDGLEWDALTVDHQFAIEVVSDANKAQNALVLVQPGLEPEADGESSFAGIESKSYLTASPNPFNPSTIIKFNQPKSSDMGISIYDVRGRLVRTVLDEFVTQGDHEVSWDGRTSSGKMAPSGLYLVRMTSIGLQESIRITLTK